MWFDARKALADRVAGNMPPATFTPATIATIATKPRPALPSVAVVARVAASQARKPRESREADAMQLVEFLSRSGPSTYGAAGSALGWGATRAWQAEAYLRALGQIGYNARGRTILAARRESFD